MRRFWGLWGRWVGGFGIRDMAFSNAEFIVIWIFLLGDIMVDKIVTFTECQRESKFDMILRYGLTVPSVHPVHRSLISKYECLKHT